MIIWRVREATQPANSNLDPALEDIEFALYIKVTLCCNPLETVEAAGPQLTAITHVPLQREELRIGNPYGNHYDRGANCDESPFHMSMISEEGRSRISNSGALGIGVRAGDDDWGNMESCVSRGKE